MAASEVAAITGLSEEASQSLLDAAGGNLEVAVQLHFDQEDSAAGSSAAARSGGGGGGGEAHGDGGDPAARPPARQPPAAAAGSGAGVLDFLSYVGGLPGFSHLRLLFVGLGRLLQRTGLLSLVLPVADLLLLTPLRLLGFLAPPPRESAAEAAARFTAEFEELHGETHPRFFRGSCSEALSRARREAKFCLVYLHSAAHPAAASTCDELIANALFAAFVDENFVFWVADDATADGRAVRQALRPRELPTLVVLAQAEGAGRGRGAQALAQVAGVRLRDVDGTVAALSETLQTWAPLLEEAREELTARAVDRAIIQEQASEYERALAEDQAREEAEVAAAAAAEEAERAAAEAAEAAEAEAAGAEAAAAARREARLAKADSLPAEPAAGSGATSLAVKLPDGRRLNRRFPPEAPLQAVVDWVEASDPDGEEFGLASSYPRKEFGRELRGSSLSELGLHPSSTLFTRELSDSD